MYYLKKKKNKSLIYKYKILNMLLQQREEELALQERIKNEKEEEIRLLKERAEWVYKNNLFTVI